VVSKAGDADDDNDGRRRAMVAGMGAWLGLALGVAGIYSTIFPWATAEDRLVGVAICLLATGVAGRAAILFIRQQIDWPLLLLGVMLFAAVLIAALGSA
jgi:hypothetical protein